MGFFENSGMKDDVFNIRFQHGIEFQYNYGRNLFRNCNNFNAPVTIPDSLTDTSLMFTNCSKFNSNVYISPYTSNITAMTSMFWGCNKFNKNINIPYYCNGSISNIVANQYNATFHVYSRGKDMLVDGDYGYWFSGINANFNINWHESPTNLSHAFEYCTKLNTNINIPSTVWNASYAFADCWTLNKNIRLHDEIDASDCFYDCYNLNQNIRIPALSDISNMFYYCTNLNQEMYVPEAGGENYFEQRANIYQLFFACKNLNSTITIDNNVKSMCGMFDSCEHFNVPIAIPENVQDMESTFARCTNFDQPVSLPSGLVEMNNTFSGCIKFTQHIDIPESVCYMSYTFRSTRITNAVYIPAGVSSLYGTFYGCTELNDEFDIPDTVYFMQNTFGSCSKLNIAVNLPSSVQRLDGCFKGCSNYNNAVIIPTTVTSMTECFAYCTNYNKSIVVPDDCKVDGILMNAVNYNQSISFNHFNSDSAPSYTNCCSNTQVPTIIAKATQYNYRKMYNMFNVRSEGFEKVVARSSPNSVVANIRLNGSALYPSGAWSDIRGYFENTGVGSKMMGISNFYQAPMNYNDYIENYDDGHGMCTSSWFNNIQDGGMHLVYYDYPNCHNADDVVNHQYYIRMYLD